MPCMIFDHRQPIYVKMKKFVLALLCLLVLVQWQGVMASDDDDWSKEDLRFKPNDQWDDKELMKPDRPDRIPRPDDFDSHEWDEGQENKVDRHHRYIWCLLRKCGKFLREKKCKFGINMKTWRKKCECAKDPCKAKKCPRGEVCHVEKKAFWKMVIFSFARCAGKKQLKKMAMKVKYNADFDMVTSTRAMEQKFINAFKRLLSFKLMINLESITDVKIKRGSIVYLFNIEGENDMNLEAISEALTKMVANKDLDMTIDGVTYPADSEYGVYVSPTSWNKFTDMSRVWYKKIGICIAAMAFVLVIMIVVAGLCYCHHRKKVERSCRAQNVRNVLQENPPTYQEKPSEGFSNPVYEDIVKTPL